MAINYLDALRENVNRGNRARFQRGWPNVRPPPGYTEDPKTKTVIEDLERRHPSCQPSQHATKFLECEACWRMNGSLRVAYRADVQS